MRIHLDFETRSVCDLRKAGAYVYSKHPTTEVLCVGFSVGDDEKVRVVSPHKFKGVVLDNYLSPLMFLVKWAATVR